jgi:hypothetical protein
MRTTKSPPVLLGGYAAPAAITRSPPFEPFTITETSLLAEDSTATLSLAWSTDHPAAVVTANAPVAIVPCGSTLMEVEPDPTNEIRAPFAITLCPTLGERMFIAPADDTNFRSGVSAAVKKCAA